MQHLSSAPNLSPYNRPGTWWSWFLLLLLSPLLGWGQSNPAAHSLSGGDFLFSGFASGSTVTYPTSVQGHRFSVEPDGTTVAPPSGDFTLQSSSTGNTTGGIRNEVGNGISLLNSSSNNIGAITVALNTTGRQSVAVSWLAERLLDQAGKDNGLKLQYRVGTSGNFTDVAASAYTPASGINTAQTFSNVLLPTAADNQAVVQVRWLYYVASGTSGSRDRIRLDEVRVSSSPASATPSIGSFAPVTGTVGTVVTINGSNLAGITEVTFAGTAATNVSATATTVTATVAAGTPTGAAVVALSDGTTSYTASGTFDVTAPVPAPGITSINPNSAVVGTVVTITGTDFTGASAIRFNGVSAAYTVVNSTTITATVPSGATTGPVTVTTAGGTATSAASFTVENPVPVLTGINPASRPAGSAAFTLTATGSGFLSTTVISFNGVALPTTFVSATQLTATVPAAAITTAGTYTVTVTSPTPGGGTSAGQTFMATIGGGAETFSNLPITGSSYADGSYVGDNSITWNYTQARGDQTLNGKAITLRNSTMAAAYSAPVPGGLSSLFFSYKKPFSNNVDATVLVNNTSVGTITASATANQTFSVSGLTFTGSVEIKIVVNSGGGQVTIDDVSWEGYVPVGPEITVKQAGTDIATGGNVGAGTVGLGSSADIVLTLLNEGSQPLVLGAITAANPEFSLTGTDPSGSTLAPNASVTLTVRYAPTQAGARTGSISIANNDATGSEDPFIINFTGTATATYYTKSTGSPSDLSTFGINADGSGSAPASFSADGQVFTVQGTGRVLTTDLTIAGSGSRLALAPGAELVIPAAATYTGTLDLTAGSTLTVLNPGAATYVLGSVDAASTISFAQAGSFVVPTGPAAGYGNLTLRNGTKTLAGGTTLVRGNLLVENLSGFSGTGSTPFSVVSLLGNFTQQGTVTYGAAANGFTLQLDGSTEQTLAGNGNGISLFRLTNSNGAGAVLADAGGSTALTVGNSVSGGLLLNTGSTLKLKSNTVTLVGSGSVSGNGTLSDAASGALVISKNGSNSPGTLYLKAGEVLGNLTLDVSGSSDVLTLGNDATLLNLNLTNGTLALSGNRLSVNGTITAANGLLRGSATSELVLAGSGPIGGLGFSNSTTAGRQLGLLSLSRAGGTLTLATPLQINTTLGLTDGVINSSAASLLTLATGATITGGNPSSYVAGPLARQATAAQGLSFPLGLGTAYRPLTLNVAAQAVGTITYRAEQKNGPPADQTLNTGGALPDLLRISQVRYYTVTSSNATGFSGTITLSYGADDGVTDANDPSLVIGKNSSGSSGWSNIGQSAANATTVTSGSFTSFSSFALASTSVNSAVNPLPVTLVSFDLVADFPRVRLNWTTASELNNQGFSVERSTNGAIFAAIGQVKGHGTTTQMQHYSFLDTELPAGTLYYRLRQVDTNGKSTYSAVRVVSRNAVISLYPNPAQTELTLQLPAAETSPYQVLNMLGKVVMQGQGRGNIPLSVDGLPEGVYQLVVTTSAGRSVHRFVKQ